MVLHAEELGLFGVALAVSGVARDSEKVIQAPTNRRISRLACGPGGSLTVINDFRRSSSDGCGLV